MSHVWEHSQQKGSRLLLLLAIADFATDEGMAWPSVESLAEKSRMTVRNVQYALRALEQSGELTIERTDGGRATHRYKVMIERCKDFTPEVQSLQGRGEAHFTPGVKPISPDPLINQSIHSANGKELAEPPPKKRAAPKTDPRVRPLLARFQQTVGYELPNYGQEAKAAKWLVERHSEDDIIACWRWLVSDKWWEGKHCGLQSVRGKIGAWVQAGRPTGGGARASPKAHRTADGTVKMPNV